MSDDDESDEWIWAAERRDFVADWRDGIADGREATPTRESRQRTYANNEPTIAKPTSRTGATSRRRAVEFGLAPMRTPVERETLPPGVSSAGLVTGHGRSDSGAPRPERAASDRVEAASRRRHGADDAVGGGLRGNRPAPLSGGGL